ncbi:MAG: cytochrome c3 family protein [Humidesulfovibrio sp.]|jgi:cytochrome c553|uniref:cytochrome c3 family protein n=1 Tax=Humidesulfovibrio sp. TaxID=2910988 RepID=UPI00273470AA|nr:cytochrome c3 family protein [Humidesulfovibrio sp.]MDP2847836.1 cytochrome c3 family protein [Humidesulfovibrio sp.]
MKRSLIMSLVVAALACAMALPLYAAPAKKAPDADLTFKAPEGMKMTKSLVKFPHKKHTEVKCAACHHKKDAKGNEYGKCDSKGCHDNLTAKQGKDSYYAAFHSNDVKSCVGCHKAKKEAKPNVPTACDKCHPKA